MPVRSIRPQVIRRISVSTAIVITLLTAIAWGGDEDVLRDQPSSVYLCAMHPDVQSVSSGKCVRCRMALIRVDVGLRAGPFTCPLHPTFQATSPGLCRRCGNLLVPQSALTKYKVELQTTPLDIPVGKPITIRLTLFDPAGARVKDLSIVHEKPLHLFVISRDLTVYQHIHPTLQPDGTYAVETMLPQEGRYDVIADFAPVGAFPQVIRHTIATAGRHADDGSVRPPLVPDRSLSKILDGTRIQLSFDRSKLTTRTPLVLTFNLSDPKTGTPVRDLQPYLGAWGHTLIVSADGKDYLHSHPRVAVRQSAGGGEKPIGGPEVSFDAFFPRPGRYRMWSQFQRPDGLITASFDVEVSRLDPVAVWDGRDWSAVPAKDIDTNGSVRAVAMSGTDLYIAGDFTRVGDVPANRIARWDGRRWASLGPGVNGTVWALLVRGNTLYIAGEFTKAGDLLVNGITQWDRDKWTALGGGLTGCRDAACVPAAYALAFSGDELYAGGRFINAGSTRANGIAKWNGSEWMSVGRGVATGTYDGVVRALAVDRGSVFVGGSFKTAGDAIVNNVAKTDGHLWSPLGMGIGGSLETVFALGVLGLKLYVGGDFTSAGKISVTNAAVWDGAEWVAPGFQTNAAVHSILVNEADVYIGGAAFTLQSGRSATGVLKCGSSCSALGTGVGNGTHLAPVETLGLSGQKLYAGGGPFALPNIEETVTR